MASGAVKTDWSRFEVDDNGDFKTDADGNFVEKPMPVEKPSLSSTIESALFPTAKTVEGKGIGKSAARVGLGVLDVLDAPSRAIAKTRGMEMSDPDSYFFRPETEKAKIKDTPEAQARREDTKRIRAESLGNAASVVPSFYDPADPATLNVMIETAGRTASDPLSWIGAITKLAKAGGRGLNKVTGRLVEEASGVPEDAMRAYGDKGKRAMIQANVGKEAEIGSDLLKRLDNPENFVSEREAVGQALAAMPAKSLDVPVQALENAKGRLSTAGRSFDFEDAAREQINKDIRALRGGDLPPDLAKQVQEAGKRLQRSDIEVGLADKAADFDAKAIGKAERAIPPARKQAQAAGARVATQRKHETDFGWWHEEALRESKDAAARAREAATTARAQAAVGSLSQADLATASARQEAAARDYMVAYAANELYAKKDIREVAQRLAKEGMGADDITSVLKDARGRAQSVPTLPAQTVPARDYMTLRQKLDKKIDHANIGASEANRARFDARTAMKDDLIASAKDTGFPEYETAMQSYFDKLGMLDEVEKFLGSDPISRKHRAEGFIKNLLNEGKTTQRELVGALDGAFGGQFTDRIQSAKWGKQLGPEGVPTLFPRQTTGRSGSIYEIISGLNRYAGFPVSSPKFAANVTLPTTQAIADVSGRVSDAMTPQIRQRLREIAVANALAQSAQE